MSFRPALDLLFAPRSVAIVGASNDGARISGRPLRYLLDAGFAGPIFPVSARRTIIQGVRAWPNVRDLPEVPDVALLALSGALVEPAFADCVAMGIRAAMLLSAGFAEAGAEGRAAQARLRAIAAAAGMRALGPNCLGAFNARLRFFGTFATSLDRGFPDGGPLAIASQSGAYGQHLAYLAGRRGLGVGYLLTTGNEMDVDLGDCLGWLAEQPDVRVILAYVEGVREGGRLLAALEKARRNGVSVIVLKVGGSDVGARAAASHTAAMAGDDAVFGAVLRQYGAVRADSTEQQLDIAQACLAGPPPRGNRLCVVSVSGGAGVQAADAAARRGLLVPPMPPRLQEELQALLPFAAVGNPIDVTGQVVNDPSLLQRNLELIRVDPPFDCLLIYLTTVLLDRAASERVRGAILAGLGQARPFPVVLCMIADPAVVDAFERSGFIVFEDLTRAVAALGGLAALAAGRMHDLAATAEPDSGPKLPATRLSEPQAKCLLSAWGISVPVERVAETAADAEAFAVATPARLALKIVSPDIPHKTEVGGVLLGVEGPDAVRAGFELLLRRARQARPDAEIGGVLLTPMAPPGVELIAGAVNDTAFGPIVMVGLGGTLTEALGDVAFRVAPIDEAEADRMVDETQASVLLAGVRGAPPADRRSLSRCLSALSRLAAASAATLGTFEINPLLVLPDGQGVLALDAASIPKAGDTAA